MLADAQYLFSLICLDLHTTLVLIIDLYWFHFLLPIKLLVRVQVGLKPKKWMKNERLSQRLIGYYIVQKRQPGIANTPLTWVMQVRGRSVTLLSKNKSYEASVCEANACCYPQEHLFKNVSVTRVVFIRVI